MSGPRARYGQEDNATDPRPTETPPPLVAPLPPTAELPSHVHDPSDPYDAGGVPVVAPPGRSRESRGALIMAVVVMVAIVVASIAILTDASSVDSAGLPGEVPSAGDSGSASARPAPTSSSRADAAPIGTMAGSAGAGGVPRNGAPMQSPGRSPADAATAVPGAAKLAASSWVDAVNKQRVGTARALSCAAVRVRITASFLATVAGSIKVESIANNPSAGTTTLTFSYRKTSDIARQHDHLSLIIEAGRWMVCT